MRPLQILTNKYTAKKQELEFLIEAELNSPYPNVDTLDHLFDEMTHLLAKNGYLTQLLIDITHARTTNNIINQPTE